MVSNGHGLVQVELDLIFFKAHWSYIRQAQGGGPDEPRMGGVDGFKADGFDKPNN